MSTPFPENDVEVLRRYLPDDLHAALQQARSELTRIQAAGVLSPDDFEALGGALTPPERQEQAQAFAVNEARRGFLAVLDQGSLGQQDKPRAIVILDEITDNVMRHELSGAIDRLTTFDADAPPIAAVQLDRNTIATAFTADPITYFTSRVTKIINTPQGPREIRVRQGNTLSGYRSSARLTSAQIDLLFTLLAFLMPTAERTFRLGVMRGEVRFGQSAHAEAFQEFATLLPSAWTNPDPTVVTDPAHASGTHLGPGTVVDATVVTDPAPGSGTHLSHGALADAILATGERWEAVFVLPTDPSSAQSPVRQQFVALRAGAAQLGLGDALFRRVRSPDASARDPIRAAYAAAVRVVTRAAISSDNPLRQQIEQYAAVQTAKLDAGMNVLGYHDSFVPILRPAALQALAERRIQAATEAAQRFEAFKAKADQIQDQLRDLDFQTEIQETQLAIADEQIARAKDQVDIAVKQIDQITQQLDALDTDLLVSLGGSLVQAAASAFLAGSTGGAGVAASVIGTSVPGVVGALSGGASALAGYSARKDDLNFQKQIATIGKDVAQRDVAIAELGKQIVEATMAFLGEKIRRIQNRELNPDLYYAAAEAFRGLAERHLDAAILWAYLFERSVALLRLEPALHEIQFDYAGRSAGLLAAPDSLRADLNDVVDRNVPITKFQFLTETYSLRSLYPLEFNRFLQTGRMDFAMSLYEMNKRRPGVYRQRIKRVQVVLQFPPPSGFTGRIRHRGSFLLRDRDTTPEPGAGPFIPSGDQLQQALAALGPGATQGLPVGGVIPFLLDVDTLELSPDEPPPDLGDPAPEALMPIEGYGPAGDWTIEVENVDLRFITDALLKITYVIPESDEPLSTRVKGLISAYEQELLQGDALDLISPFSLQHAFGDAFARLSSGQTEITVARNDFPAGITDLKLKTIVAQALDANKKGVAGVALELSKPDTAFHLERSTRADGFTEDVTAAIPTLPAGQRVDLEGTYAIRLVEPGRFGALSDLLLFFVYEFRGV